MKEENKWFSIKVSSYAMIDFLHALITNGFKENGIAITKEDNDLIVRLNKNELQNAIIKCDEKDETCEKKFANNSLKEKNKL